MFHPTFLPGKNIIGVGGKLSYHPPFVLETEHVTDDSTHPRNLSCLSGIGLLAVFDCLLNVCPSVAFNGLIVNMDYKVQQNHIRRQLVMLSLLYPTCYKTGPNQKLHLHRKCCLQCLNNNRDTFVYPSQLKFDTFHDMKFEYKALPSSTEGINSTIPRGRGKICYFWQNFEKQYKQRLVQQMLVCCTFSTQLSGRQP